MKELLKRVRDNPVVLGLLVICLRAIRACGVPVPRRVYRHVPYRGLVRVDCGADRSFVMNSEGSDTANRFYWEGLTGYEPESLRRWIQYAAHAQCVLDIGANVGVYALLAAAVGARNVHAFEPLQRVRRMLQSNVDANCFERIAVSDYCISDHEGHITMFDPGGDAPNSASASSTFANEKLADGTVQQITVRTISVDAYCVERGITKVDLIKIDVEGFEVSVLGGMRKTIADSRPVILMEVLEPADPAMSAVLDQLRAAGYAINRIHEGAGHRDFNLLLTPFP